MAFNSGRSASFSQRRASSGLKQMIYPDDLHSVGDFMAPASYPDSIRIGIHSKPGASLAGIKNFAKDQYRTAKAAVLGNIENATAKGGMISKLTDQIKELDSEDKSDKEKIEQLEAKIEQVTELSKSVLNIKKEKIIKNADGTETKISVADQRLASLENNFEVAGQLMENIGNQGTKFFKGAYNAFVKNNNAASRNAETPIAGIYLPMPDNVTFSEPVEWAGTDLGMLAPLRDKIFEEGGPSGANLGNATLGQVGSIVGGGAGALVSGLFGGGLIGGALVGALGGGAQAQAAIETTYRIKSNPFKEQTFGGVPFRAFEFSWTFSPRNDTEMATLENIIRTIRGHSKPTFQADSDKTLFNYPDEFTLNFLTLSDKGNLTENSHLPKLKNLVCKSVNSNYTTAGWRSFKDGAPTSVTLQVSFEEIDIVTREDIMVSDGSTEQKDFVGGH